MNLNHFSAGIWILIFAGLIVLSIAFLTEGSGRASLRALLPAFIISVPFIIFSLSGNYILQLAGEIVTFVTIVCGVILILPIKGKRIVYSIANKTPVDERDTMFSREELKPGTGLYNNYYRNHPEKESKDNLWRSEPGLLSPSSLFHSKMAFAAAEASLDTVELFADMRDNDPAIPPSELSEAEVTRFIRRWGRKLGAVGVGFTEMADYHYYTIAGRGDRYGKKIVNEQKYGIVFLVAMDLEMISSAPRAPVVMESASQYLRSASIATQVAVMIRKLGYGARTHIDANYDLICPLVAKDAGLGEIGRNGLLISDRYGPRVRISVVTTDIPLQTDKPRSDSSVIKFCSICKKCALNCPSNSIPEGPMQLINGVMKWQLDQESCYTYWNHCGTDCGICISTCPYSHTNNFFHNIIRKGIRNNIFFLRLASILDDFFYGKRPASVNVTDLVP